jgi:DNA/RNA endonuclease YhcR with UshA esterase domain
MKKLTALLLVLAMVFTFAACTKPADPKPVDIFAKSEGVLTHADYVAAANDTEVTIEAFIQSCAYSAAYGNASLFLADKDGGYFIYRMNVTEDEAKKLTEGAKIRVKGFKSEWAGEVEIIDATFEALEGTYTADAIDVTLDLYSNELLSKNMNRLVSFKDLVVAGSIDADGNEVPFLYNWDGSGAKGSNNDLYFNVNDHGNVYNFCIESDECPEGSDVYKAVEALKVGDVVDLEGFLYWYYGPNPHIHSLTVTTKSAGSSSAKSYADAALDTEVTVEAAVTGVAYNETYGNVSMFLQDSESGYYVYRMNVTPDDMTKILNASRVKITGYKSEWAGEVEITDATYEVVDGAGYKPAALDVTALLGTDKLIKHMNKYVAFKGVTVEASKDANGNDAAFLYNWDGSGAAGSNNDLYFNVSVNGETYTFTVESDECAEGSDPYEMVTQLKIGDVVDLEGFLYWYNGANPHITKVLSK